MNDDGYPQALRSTWADASAAKCSAIWRCVDARARLALACLGPASLRAQLEAELAQLVAAKDAALARCLDAREQLEAAEAVYYAVPA